ncbi:MAG: pantoate--beta-alanine ligase [Firmicutes bacterium]|nr:pantoate--beta-alanine ligase [Bacillota bacterium]
MQIFQTIPEIRKFVQTQRECGKKIGLVPTMGYLHEGHLSLVRRAAEDGHTVVVSIFVNPLQFGVGEDYEEYPRDLTRDVELLEQTGLEVVLFAPAVKEMYPQGYATFVEVERLTSGLCGRSRPGHFRGVTTVVTKLFNIVQPDKAYFGQKDAQQAIVIKRMVADLNQPLEIVVAPIVREADGLAMSSRNVYLNPEERRQAVVLFQSLQLAREMIEQGCRDVAEIKEAIIRKLQSAPLASIDYVEIVDGVNLEEITTLAGPVLIALAVRFGKTRLIDNIMLEVS